jgi:cysteine synthase B
MRAIPDTKGRKMNLLQAIGHTPLVELVNINERLGVRILCKLEGCNPGGSVKDRPALSMITRAEERGELVKGSTILEPTSGNTGIAIAMIGAAKGYRVELCMPECVSLERSLILQGLGASVFLTPAKDGIDGAIRKAHSLREQEPDRYFMPNQYENPDNALAHWETTGPESYEQTGVEVDFFVAGMGTTGTLMGTGRYLKSKVPGVRIVGVEPEMGHAIQGLKNMTESMVPGIYEPDDLDAKLMVTDGEAFEMTKLLARHEGLFVGSSSGAAVAVALRIASELHHGTIVALLPDRGDRYLSTMQFRSICGKCPA